MKWVSLTIKVDLYFLWNWNGIVLNNICIRWILLLVTYCSCLLLNSIASSSLLLSSSTFIRHQLGSCCAECCRVILGLKYIKYVSVCTMCGLWAACGPRQPGLQPSLSPMFLDKLPRVGSWVVRIHPLRFLAECRTKRLNQVWFCFIS